MKRKITFLIAALCAVMLITQPVKVMGQKTPTTIWSENFDGLAADATPTTPTNAAYEGVTYTCTDGTGTSSGKTKIMTTQIGAGGASSPEMMVGKKGSGAGAAGGKFTVSVPLNNMEGTLTLTYYQNAKGLSVSSPNASGGQTSNQSGQKTTTFTGITTSMTSITIVFQATTTNNVRLDDIVLTGTQASSGTTAAPTISGNNPFLTNTTITITNAASADGADIFYTLNGDAPTTTTSATCFAYSTPFSIDATKTVKAIAKKSTDTNASSPVSATFTKVTPITVSAALTAISSLGNNGTIADQCVSGIVCTAGSLNSGTITYYISADGTESNRLQVYKGKGLYNANFEAASDIAVGDEVVVYGTLKNYNNENPEFDQGSYLLSKVRKPSPELAWSAASYTATYGGSITYPTLSNPHSVTVTYSSSETNVATIDSSTGEITLNANGDTNIKATFAGNATYSAQEVSYTLTVAGMLEAPGFSFEENEINMPYDEDYEGQNLTNPNSITVTYESSDTDVADVDENTGELALYKAGTVTITANFAGNTTYAAGSASYTLNVTKAAAGLVFDEIGPFNVLPDADFDVPTFSNPHSLTVTWASTDEDVAVVDAGVVVIGNKLGTAVITASFDGDDRYNAGEASYTIIVTPVIMVTWDLSKKTYDDIEDPNIVTWSNAIVTMTNSSESGGTSASNYLGGDSNNRTSSRFYGNNILTINPTANYAITSVIFTATSSGYASAFAGSTWTNAMATASAATAPFTVTVTPKDAVTAFYATIGGTCGFTSVTVSLLSIPNTSNVLNENVTIPENTKVSLATLEIPSDQSYVLTVSGVLEVTGTLTNSVPGHLIIEDGGQLVLKSTNTDVRATFEKDITSAAKDAEGNWYTISTPTGGINITSVTNLVNNAGGDLKYNLFRYKESTHMWEAYNTTNHATFTTLEKGRGYLYRNNGKPLSFAGEVNVGDVTGITLSRTETSGNLKGFNLIGNPFGHNIYKGKGASIDNSDLSEGFYYLNDNGGWQPGTCVDPIAPNMGVLVQVGTGTSTSLTIKDNTVAPTEESKYADDNLMFTVANDKYEDVTYAIFHKGYGLNKINHRNADIPMLYINHDNDDYAIAMLSDDTKAFNLCFKAKTTGQYKLTYKAEGEFSYLHIIDRLTGTDVDMLLEGEYNFIGTPHDNENRFIVSLGYLPDYGEGNNDIFAFQNGSDILVSGQGELQIFDVTGRMVKNMNINGAGTINVQTQGVYILRLVGTEVKTQKIVVK